MLRKCFGIIKGKRSANGKRQDTKVDLFNAMQKPGLIRIATLSGFAVSGIAVLLPAASLKAQEIFLPKRPIIQRAPNSIKNTIDRLVLFDSNVRISNPLGFTIEEKKGANWEPIGSGKTITRRYKIATRIEKKYRIVPRLEQQRGIFYHSGGPLHMGMYNRQVFSITVTPSKNQVLNIRPQEIRKSAYLGHGQIFGSNGQPMIESSICSYLIDDKLVSSWIPYYGGTINGRQATGSKSRYLIQGTSIRDFRNWCRRNRLQSSGFISKDLSISEMVAAILNPTQIIKRSTVAPMPVNNNQGRNYWVPDNRYAAYIYDSQSKNFTKLTRFNRETRQLLVNVFRDRSKTFYLVRNIKKPTAGVLKTEVADFSGLLQQLNGYRASLTASGGGGAWYFDSPDGRSRIDIKSILNDIDDDYDGLKIYRRPRRITTQGFQILPIRERGSFKFKLVGTINLPSIDGELNHDWGPDYDYEVSRGTINVDVPIQASVQNSRLSIRSLKDCRRNSCVGDPRGWRFSLTWIPSAFVRDIERSTTRIFRDAVKTQLNDQIGTRVRQLTSRSFTLPSPPVVPGLGNPLERLFGVSPNILPNLSIAQNESKLYLNYTPQVVFVSPAYISSFIRPFDL